MTITEPSQQHSTPERKSHRRSAFAIAGGLLLVGGVAIYAAGWTGLMGVNAVEVEGASTLSPEELIAVADIPQGTPMMRVDVRAATARLADLPQLSSVDVRREWPRTVVLSVSERGAVAVQKAADGWELLDDKGIPFAVVPDRPKDLPTVARSGDEATNTAMLAALAQMSPEVRSRVAQISATSPNAIRLTLRKSDAVVNWGSPEQSDYKSDVLAVLLDVDAGWYDVSNPDTPTSADAEPRPATPAPDTDAEPTASPSAVNSAPVETPEPAATVAESPVGVVPQTG
jgi:cell division protein FtsQ